MVEAAHEDRRRGGGWAVLGAILLLSALVRVPGLTGGYWLDEAWTVTTAREMSRLSDVLAERNLVDNNHPLTTAWVFLVGDGIPGRLLSFVSALAAIVSAWRIGARRGRATGAWTAAVVGTSFPLAVYGTEARGFAPAVACALACLDLADDPRRSGARSVAFATLAFVGALAHFTFVAALAGAFAVSVSARRWKDLLTLHAPALLAAVVVYLGFVRHLKIAGGTPGEAWRAALDMASLLANGPDSGVGAVVVGWSAAVVGIAVLSGSLLRGRQARRAFGADMGKTPDPPALGPGGFETAPVAVGHRVNVDHERDVGALVWAAIASVVAAGGMLAARNLMLGHADVVYPRYFLVAGAVATLAASVVLAGGAWAARASRIAAGAGRLLLAGVCVAGVGRTLHFGLGPGRGDYLTPLVVVASSDAPTLTSDYDSRTLRLLAYYGPRLPALLRYSRDARGGARWHLHNTGTNAALTDRIDVGGVAYVLRHRYPKTGPSGWEWGLYERE